MKRILCVLVVLSALASAQNRRSRNEPAMAEDSLTHGPLRGSLLLQGGVGLNHAIDSEFVALAGGAE